MSEATQRAKRIGGSLMIRIPKDIAEIEGIHEGDPVNFTVKKSRRDFFGITPGLKPFYKEEDRFDSDDEYA